MAKFVNIDFAKIPHVAEALEKAGIDPGSTYLKRVVFDYTIGSAATMQVECFVDNLIPDEEST